MYYLQAFKVLFSYGYILTKLLVIVNGYSKLANIIAYIYFFERRVFMSKDLGVMVRSELFKRKMTQRELAKMLGISSVYLSDIINGRKDGPKPQEHIKHIRKILSI